MAHTSPITISDIMDKAFIVHQLKRLNESLTESIIEYDKALRLSANDTEHDSELSYTIRIMKSLAIQNVAHYRYVIACNEILLTKLN